MRFVSLLFCLLAAAAVIAQGEEDPAPPAPEMRRCINLGNMLEAPNEGDWGLIVREEWLPIIAEAGFDSVRIPVRWSAHAAEDAPYTIDPDFLARVDQVISWALDAGLNVLLNVHHYEEIHQDPDGHAERLLGLWQQLAPHYQDYPAALRFEVMNEPFGQLSAERWNEIQVAALEIIRASNPTRVVVLGGVEWNSFRQLPFIELPEDRANLLVTFHYYEPFEFTHQGAEWAEGSEAWLGRPWPQDGEEARLAADFAFAAEWGERHGLPLFLGEFGAYSRADLDSRLRFTEAVARTAEAHEIAWCYWEFASGFGIYDAGLRRFNELHRALIPPD